MSESDNVLPFQSDTSGQVDDMDARAKAALLDVNGAADRLGVSPRFIRRLIAQRRIDYLKIGKFIRFDPDDLETWIDDHRIERTSYEAS